MRSTAAAAAALLACACLSLVAVSRAASPALAALKDESLELPALPDADAIIAQAMSHFPPPPPSSSPLPPPPPLPSLSSRPPTPPIARVSSHPMLVETNTFEHVWLGERDCPKLCDSSCSCVDKSRQYCEDNCSKCLIEGVPCGTKALIQPELPEMPRFQQTQMQSQRAQLGNATAASPPRSSSPPPSSPPSPTVSSTSTSTTPTPVSSHSPPAAGSTPQRAAPSFAKPTTTVSTSTIPSTTPGGLPSITVKIVKSPAQPANDSQDEQLPASHPPPTNPQLDTEQLKQILHLQSQLNRLLNLAQPGFVMPPPAAMPGPYPPIEFGPDDFAHRLHDALGTTTLLLHPSSRTSLLRDEGEALETPEDEEAARIVRIIEREKALQRERRLRRHREHPATWDDVVESLNKLVRWVRVRRKQGGPDYGTADDVNEVIKQAVDIVRNMD